MMYTAYNIALGHVDLILGRLFFLIDLYTVHPRVGPTLTMAIFIRSKEEGVGDYILENSQFTFG